MTEKAKQSHICQTPLYIFQYIIDTYVIALPFLSWAEVSEGFAQGVPRSALREHFSWSRRRHRLGGGARFRTWLEVVQRLVWDYVTEAPAAERRVREYSSFVLLNIVAISQGF